MFAGLTSRWTSPRACAASSASPIWVDDARDARKVHRAAVDDLAQVRARHVAHGEVQDPVLLAAAVDRDDVRVLERRREPRLGLEAGDGRRVLGVLRGDDLQRDGPVELGI